jgi:hypothetical protein
MGLFGGSQTYVSSVLYNSAGDYPERTDYLKFLISSGTLVPSSKSLGDTLIEGTLGGPASRLKSFYRWAETHYEDGIPARYHVDSVAVDPDVVEAAITPSGANMHPWVQAASFGRADYLAWAEQWIMANFPGRITSAWRAEINTSHDITILWAPADGWTDVSFSPTNFAPRAKYVYARYAERERVAGTWVSVSQPQMFIYRIGDGNAALDALDSEGPSFGGFFPMLPLRTFGTFVNEAPYASSIEDEVRSAWKRASGGGRLDTLLEQIQDNEDLADIDHAAVVFGVPLNTQSKHGLRYLYEFLRDMVDLQAGSEEGYAAFEDTTYPSYQAYISDLKDWIADVEAGGTASDPPPRLALPQTAETTIRLHPPHEHIDHLDFYLSWKFIKESTHVGLGRTGAQKGDLWIEKLAAVHFDDEYYTGASSFVTRDLKDEVFALYWQDGVDSYRRLRVVGLTHKNLIYNNKAVTLTSDQALDDPDDSGFFLPLVYSTLGNLPLVSQNQVCLESTLLVFNCFEVVKQKWYQTWIFKLVLVVVSIGIGVGRHHGAAGHQRRGGRGDRSKRDRRGHRWGGGQRRRHDDPDASDLGGGDQAPGREMGGDRRLHSRRGGRHGIVGNERRGVPVEFPSPGRQSDEAHRGRNRGLSKSPSRRDPEYLC